MLSLPNAPLHAFDPLRDSIPVSVPHPDPPLGMDLPLWLTSSRLEDFAPRPTTWAPSTVWDAKLINCATIVLPTSDQNIATKKTISAPGDPKINEGTLLWEALCILQVMWHELQCSKVWQETHPIQLTSQQQGGWKRLIPWCFLEDEFKQAESGKSPIQGLDKFIKRASLCSFAHKKYSSTAKSNGNCLQEGEHHMCMHVCVCVCMYINVIYIYICVCACVNIHIHVHVCVRAYTSHKKK